MERHAILYPRQLVPTVLDPIGYIYITTNLINGKKYVGKHTAKARDFSYIGSGAILNKAISKYGRINFDSEPVYWCSSSEELNSKEIEFIDYFGAVDSNNWYNLSVGGDGYQPGSLHPMYGKTHSKEYKEHMSKLLSGKNNPNYGAKSFNPDVIEKIRSSSVGRIVSEETRKKLSVCSSGINNPMYGKSHSEKTKKLISESKKGISHSPHSEETRRKISQANKGKKRSKECVEAMSKRNLGANSSTARRIVQLTGDYKLVREFSYMKEAEELYDFKQNQVRDCCKHRTKMYKGYIWMYIEEYNLLLKKGELDNGSSESKTC